MSTKKFSNLVTEPSYVLYSDYLATTPVVWISNIFSLIKFTLLIEDIAAFSVSKTKHVQYRGLYMYLKCHLTKDDFLLTLSQLSIYEISKNKLLNPIFS